MKDLLKSGKYLTMITEEERASERMYREEMLLGFTPNEDLEHILGCDIKEIYAQISAEENWN